MTRPERPFRKWLVEACDPRCAGAGLFIGVLLGQILTVSIDQHNRRPGPVVARAAAQSGQPAPAQSTSAQPTSGRAAQAAPHDTTRPAVASAPVAKLPQIGW